MIKKFLIIFLVFLTGLVGYWQWRGKYLTATNILLSSQNPDLMSQNLILIRVEPMTQTLTIINLSGKNKIEVLGGYGEYDLGAVLALLKIEKKNSVFQTAVFSQGLKIIVDQIWPVEHLPDTVDKISVFTIVQAVFSSSNSWQQKIQALNLWLNTLNYQINYQNPKLLSDLSLDEKADACALAVVNTINKTGLAKKIADILTKNGLRVVRVTDQEPKLAESKINLTSDSNCLPLAKRLLHILPASSGLEFVSKEQLAQIRAEVVIWLGEDLIDY